MSVQIPQPSPQQIFSAIYIEDGRYSVEFPVASCFAKTANGGFIGSFIHYAAVDFVKRNVKAAKHPHMWCASLSFLRPTLSEPQTAVLSIRMANVVAKCTSLHVEMFQGDNICVAGYITLTNLSISSGLSIDTKWELHPPPLYAMPTVEELEACSNPDWVSYRTPLDQSSVRHPQSYIRYHLPVKRQPRNILEHWMTPDWEDEHTLSIVEKPQQRQGRKSQQSLQMQKKPVFTNELIHILIDNGLPPSHDLLSKHKNKESAFYEDMVNSGVTQRQLREQGKPDRVWVRGMYDSDLPPIRISTVSITTEVKKLLPPEGARALFMRSTIKAIINGRADYEILLFDEHGDLVAISQHVLSMMPLSIDPVNSNVKANSGIKTNATVTTKTSIKPSL